MTIDSILTEWQFRLKKGYPTTAADYDILRDVLKEMTTLSEYEQDRIVRRSMGLTEDEPADIEQSNNSSSTFIDANSFEKFIHAEYSVEGQQFIGLNLLYDRIKQSSNSDKLFSMILDLTKKPLHAGEYRIQGLDADLYNIIRDTIKIPNGHFSELWFAIKFNGEVKGAVAGNSIVSDVEVGDDGVSLKDYAKLSTVDFGTLDAAATMLLKTAVNSFEMMTGIEINKSMTRDSINKVLDRLDSEELKHDIHTLVKLANDTNITVIRRFVENLQKFMPDNDPGQIVENFCMQLNENIQSKIFEVKWWGIINNGILYLETQSEILETLKCKSNRISPAIANFKGSHLFVNGNTINAMIKHTRLDSSQEG
jgi:hypothetical protein